MTLPLWAIDLTETFWLEVGGVEPFPRTLRGSLLNAPYDLTVKELPGLSIQRVEAYLCRLGAVWTCGERERPLRACLVAMGGAGFIFLDEVDDQAERVYSLAHELAHFLRHYRQPRQRVAKAVGEQVLEVFEGLRPPRPEERLHALLHRVTVGAHLHLMRRELIPSHARESLAEEEADLLARELLAPRDEVLTRWASTKSASGGGIFERLRLEAILLTDFGLPAGEAREYAATLWLARLGQPGVPLSSPLLDRLRYVREVCDEPRP